ncbi:MAG: MEDS domain-containing protein [Ilumatobacteraceae bacterium]
MTSAGSVDVSGARSYIHQAFFYETPDELIDALVPFVNDGREAGENVLVVISKEKGAMLLERLGTSDGFQLLDSVDVYTSPTKTLAAYIATVRGGTNDGRAMRVAGEPIWTGLSAVEIAEWACVESACNVAFAGSRLTMFCPYDTSVLDPAIIAAARQTHPELRSVGRIVTSDHYFEPSQFHSMVRATDMPSPSTEHEACSIVSADELWRIQLFVDAFSELHALPPKLTNDLRAGVIEVAKTAFEGTAGPVKLFLWIEANQVFSDVVGSWQSVPFAGYIPHSSEEHESPGLWSVGQACDLIAVREHGAVTTVRLKFYNDTELVNPTCQEYAEFLGVYAIGACNPSETVMIEGHLAECSSCWDEVERFGSVVAMMRVARASDAAWPTTHHPDDDPPTD